MSLVSAKMMLEHARDNHYGVAAININNLEWTKLVLEVAQEKNSPMLLGVSEGAVKYMGGFNVVVQMVRGLVQDLNITVPVALHLDHGSFDGAKKAIAAGFTSVMYDGSHLPLEENLAKTREIVKLAHEKGVSVEAEVGSIGGEEDGVVGLGELADPVECQMLADTGIDFLAAGIGNIHGVYPDNWQGLDFELLAEVQKASNNLPLVLHGGTGIPEDQVLKAISLGVAKINVNTELQIAFAAGTREYIEAGLDQVGKGFDPRKLLKPGSDKAKEVVATKIEMFGSDNKAASM